jgi:tellurite resistance protein TehA-like permease
LMYKTTWNKVFEIISLILFVFLIFLLFIIITNTIKAIIKKEICIEE